MQVDEFVSECLAAWKDGRREKVIEALRRSADRVRTGRAYAGFRRSLKGYRRSYVGPLTSYLRRALRELETLHLDEIDTEKVSAWMKSMERKGVSPWTRKNIRRALAAFTAWAARGRLIPSDPVKPVRSPRIQHDPDALNPENVRGVLEAAKGHPGQMAVALALLAGLRRGEIAALDWSHVDFQRGCLDLPASVVKGGTKKRSVPMHPELMKLLSTRLLEAPDLRPAGGAHPDTYSDWAAEILEKAGVRKVGENRALQVLRRTWVSVLRHRGVAAETVTAWAGHSIDVEERHYRKSYSAERPDLIGRIIV